MTGHNGKLVGYARVSTAEQNEARQLAALGDVDTLFIDKASGRSTERSQLQALLSYVRDGDTVRVKSADRLARSTVDLLKLIEQFRADGINVEFVDSPGLNTDSAHGKFLTTLLGALAELEIANTRDRQAEGIALAKARGVYDRSPKLSVEQVDDAREKIYGLGVPLARVARELGVSRQTVYTALKGAGTYAAK
ncbi:recombinase family protein [Demequina sp. SO4-13]|uniref:recombinase family protein n=1 Tax=Demequina sp. SO4-13 TaxID=3401027 RepID=UPI003AF7272D